MRNYLFIYACIEYHKCRLWSLLAAGEDELTHIVRTAITGFDGVRSKTVFLFA